MKKIILLFLLSSIILSNGCVLFVAKPIKEDIVFNNMSGEDVTVNFPKEKRPVVSIKSGDSDNIEIDNSYIVGIKFDKSNIMRIYNLSELGVSIPAENKLTRQIICGYVHFRYICFIAPSGTLRFEGLDNNGKDVECAVKPTSSISNNSLKTKYKQIP
jgi:hypothetical protein